MSHYCYTYTKLYFYMCFEVPCSYALFVPLMYRPLFPLFENSADCVPTMSLGSVYSLSRTIQKVDRLPLDVYKRAEFVLDSRVRVQQKEQGVESGEVEHGRRENWVSFVVFRCLVNPGLLSSSK